MCGRDEIADFGRLGRARRYAAVTPSHLRHVPPSPGPSCFLRRGGRPTRVSNQYFDASDDVTYARKKPGVTDPNHQPVTLARGGDGSGSRAWFRRRSTRRLLSFASDLLPNSCRKAFTQKSLDQHTGVFNDGRIGADLGELDVGLAQGKRDNQQPQS
jgi:hypothetical protein